LESNEAAKLLEVNRGSKWIPRVEREPPFPVGEAELFRIFQELNAARGHNGFSYNPLSYAELDAYSRLTGRSLSPWEVRMLKRLDMIYLTAHGKGQKIASKAGKR